MIRENILLLIFSQVVFVQNFTDDHFVISKTQYGDLHIGIHDYNFSSVSELINIRVRIEEELKEKHLFILCTNVTMKKFPPKLFEDVAKIWDFSAVNVELEEINREDFRSAGDMLSLDLSKNKISRLENMVFMHVKVIILLNLSRNIISWIHDNAFEEANILSVDLSFNRISIFKEDYIHHWSAEFYYTTVTVNLQGNEIEEIVKSNKTVGCKVDTLDLSQNKLRSFDFSCEMVELRLDNNNLTELSIASNLTTVVSAKNNRIVDVKCAEECNLATAFLSGNQNLGDMALKRLKSASKLKVLDLSHTSLRSLSVDSFANFEALKELNIDSNLISVLDFGIFSHQKNLKKLNLSHNAIAHIDPHKFVFNNEIPYIA